jgi:hypothetical protein
MQLGTSYFGNRWLDHAEKDLRDIKASHCNWVLQTFDEVDLRFNQANLKALTKLSHKQGLKVYYSPWAVGGIFGGESLSAFVGYHPEAAQVLSTGERTAHACPAHPEFRRFMKTWIEAACAAGGDVLFWDEPHLWIAAWEGRKEKRDEYSVGSVYAQQLFKKRYGKAIPKHRDAQVDEFREWILYDFLKWATETAKKVRPSIKNAVCLLPHVNRWPNTLWEKVAAMKSVDIFATDPYWKRFPYSNPGKDKMEGYVDLFAQRLVEIGKRHKKETQIWFQLFALRKQDEPDIDKAIGMFEKAGVKNIGAWGYRGCGSFSLIASERPDACWKRVSKAYGRLAAKAKKAKK